MTSPFSFLASNHAREELRRSRAAIPAINAPVPYHTYVFKSPRTPPPIPLPNPSPTPRGCSHFTTGVRHFRRQGAPFPVIAVDPELSSSFLVLFILRTSLNRLFVSICARATRPCTTGENRRSRSSGDKSPMNQEASDTLEHINSSAATSRASWYAPIPLPLLRRKSGNGAAISLRVPAT